VEIARKRPAGMPAFTIIWFGQMVSFLGTGMTRFALAIWAWQITGSATALALVAFFSYGPTVLMSPIAGALVDRWNRKLVMMLSDLSAGLSTTAILLLYTTGNLHIWHLYVAGAFAGAFEAFQWPAYSAAITTMLPKQQYSRANGMMSLVESVSMIGSPILAGILIGLIGIGGVMTIDVITFVFAIGTLGFVHIPQPAATAAGQEGRGSLWKESAYGFHYILQRPSLLGLQLIFLSVNLLFPFFYTILNPMILARTGDNGEMLGTVLSIIGIGGVLGGLAMSTWGGPKRRVHGVLGGIVLTSLLGQAVMGLGQALPVWAVAGFFSGFFIPIANGSSQAIWQAKVAPDVQGRVFAVRRLIAQIAGPLGMLIAGPLADKLFEPAMQPGGALVSVFSGLVGGGPGAGMALMMVLAGLLGAAVSLVGYLFPTIRDVETMLPDHDAVAVEA
jgi:DHA3 family macrolide efflux protein-like MFS transporter